MGRFLAFRDTHIDYNGVFMTKTKDRSRSTDSKKNGGAVEASTEADRGPPSMRVVGIGTSAGGLAALKKLFASLPEQPGVCFVVVMHLSPEHESHLASLIQPQCSLPVEQVTRTTLLEPNHVYVISPGVNLSAIDTHLHLSDLEQQRQERAPIDHFFRTLADAHQELAVGVVLTGTGSDGTAGLRRIRERGGMTIVQSPEEAQYDAMPRNAIAAGAADFVLPLQEMVTKILEVKPAVLPVEGPAGDSMPPQKNEGILQEILGVVHRHTGHDFSQYKRSTILRRIRRRMHLHRLEHLSDYHKLLCDHEEEGGLLFEDMLIPVTEFFRDKAVFEHLQARVIPQLFKDKGPKDCVRVWSVGCATGEEAYSLAMLLMEEETRRAVKVKQLQIFATDLHEPSLRKARVGLYPGSIEAGVSRERLNQFFLREGEDYCIRKQVRERVVFALHNVLQDPPFSHVQMISCRNLLIYLQRNIQQDLMTLFHYALEAEGLLLVGSAEGIESELFECEDKKLGLYRRRNVPTPRAKPSTFPVTASRSTTSDQLQQGPEPTASYGVMHEQAVELYAPPSVLINPEGVLVHYSARAGRYLQMSGGTPTNNIYELLPEPLRFEPRAAMHTTRDQESGYRPRPIGVEIHGKPIQVILRVLPVDLPQMDGYFLVIFDELDDKAQAVPVDPRSREDATAYELEAELDQTKKRMKTLIQEHDVAQERSQAYNEELESTNEELRSTMEELETSKEEMQSMNEELTTLNQENRQKVLELDELSSDLHNLLTATDIATIFLDREMRIRRFTPSMGELFNLRESDRGRSLADLTLRLVYDQLQQDFQRVLAQLTPVEREVTCDRGRWYLTRLQCYRTGDDRIEGVVITYIDITGRKNAEEEARQARIMAEEVVDTVRNPMLVLGDTLRVQDTNSAFDRMFNLKPGEITGQLIYELKDGQWDIPELRQLLENILPENQSMEDFELEHHFSTLGTRNLLMNARRIDHLQLILLAIEDVTERKQARQTLERSRHDLERIVAQRTAELQLNATRLQMMIRTLATAEQRERKRMASILHDDLQQLLVAMKIHLGIACRDNKDPATARSLEVVGQTLDEALTTTRTLVRQVAPQTLYEDGLIPALLWLSEEMTRHHRLQVKILADETEPVISDEIKTMLFESIREMLFNIVKHARVDQATVAVHQEEDRLNITVSDQGVGFDVKARMSQEGKSEFGVFSRCSRIEALGGQWSIDTSPGRGTRVHISLPIDTHPSEEVSTDLQVTPDALALPAAPENVRDREKQVRVLIVDDHNLVRSGIISILNLDKRVKVIGEAGDGIEALTAIELRQPDVVLMDVNMPRKNGIETTREIVRRWPDMIVIGLSMQNKADASARAMTKAGAAAFLSKSDDSQRMIETILRLTNARSDSKSPSAGD